MRPTYVDFYFLNIGIARLKANIIRISQVSITRKMVNMSLYRPFALPHCAFGKIRTSNVAVGPVNVGRCWSDSRQKFSPRSSSLGRKA